MGLFNNKPHLYCFVAFQKKPLSYEVQNFIAFTFIDLFLCLRTTNHQWISDARRNSARLYPIYSS